MREPKRKAEEDKRLLADEPDHHLTTAAISRFEKKLEDLKKNQRPPAIKEVQRTAEMGDFSENAAYSEAKWKLRRINSQILSIEERLKRAIPIESGTDDSGRIRIGSTVLVYHNGKQREYEIVGSTETDPSRGRISHASPLGSTLLDHKAGDTILVEDTEYNILEVK